VCSVALHDSMASSVTPHSTPLLPSLSRGINSTQDHATATASVAESSAHSTNVRAPLPPHIVFPRPAGTAGLGSSLGSPSLQTLEANPDQPPWFFSALSAEDFDHDSAYGSADEDADELRLDRVEEDQLDIDGDEVCTCLQH
jgi:hypothetical protein